ncbi:MAG: ABC transporter ATP-binding protein, partial [Xanthomonadaceae bacterium]|nr:ABC transporter ATP-binding protein [Xanthomonadaceae bacterium]
GFYTLLGPSGCGKTTLLRCIAGFYEIDAGRLLFDQDDMTHIPTHRRDIGMVFQDYALFPDKTAFDTVAYGLRARRIAKSEIGRRVNEAMEKVGLLDLVARYPAQMSGGQRQRVALARALVIRPRVLLMDEPLSNLDAKMRMQMRDVILDLVQEARITTVFVTHDQEEALAMSDKIAIMDQGRIAQIGTPEQLYGAPDTAYVADFIGSANVIAVPVESIDSEISQGAEASGPEKIQYRLGGRRLQGLRGASRWPGRAGVLVARPEELSLLAPDRVMPNTVPGTVLRRQYLGFKTTYRVRLQDGPEIRVDLGAGNGPIDFQPGASVQIMISAQSRIIPE